MKTSFNNAPELLNEPDHSAPSIEINEEQCAVCGYIGWTIEQSFCEVSNEWYPSKELMRLVDGDWVCVEHIEEINNQQNK